MSYEQPKKEKIKVAFIYKSSYGYMSPEYYDTTMYNFFMIALKRNNRLDVSYFPSQNDFDTSQIKDKFDVILLPNNNTDGTPNLIGIERLDIPVISRTGDPHSAKRLGQFQYHEKFKIDYYFNFMPESYFYKFYPRDFRYKTIVWGLEPSIYQNLTPFKERIKNKIINSGQIGNIKLKSRIANRILNPHRSNWYFYKLRTMCSVLPYVEQHPWWKEDPITKKKKFVGNDYPLLLAMYRGATAATTFYPTIKYYEVPAAGCLTFMEINDFNDATFLGFQDKKSAIFINEKNYKQKFQEFLENPDDPQWENIANEGRDHALKELSNDKAVESLVDLMDKLI